MAGNLHAFTHILVGNLLGQLPITKYVERCLNIFNLHNVHVVFRTKKHLVLIFLTLWRFWFFRKFQATFSCVIDVEGADTEDYL